MLLKYAVSEDGALHAEKYYNTVREEFASTRPARDSQLWHRDPANDEHLLKVFVYLTDVDEGAGPFMYAAGTHPEGDVKQQPQSHPESQRFERGTDGPKVIVAGVDGSDSSLRAAAYASGLAPRRPLALACTRASTSCS